jgi:hypothetical protein
MRGSARLADQNQRGEQHDYRNRTELGRPPSPLQTAVSLQPLRRLRRHLPMDGEDGLLSGETSP